VIELGLSDKLFQESFETYKEHVTSSWLVSIWEKCDAYGVKILMNDITIKLTRERDKWPMWEFVRVGYKGAELRRLNRVQLYQMVIFLSDVIRASGRFLDERYLRKRPAGEKWSTLKFPKEKPSPAGFPLWQQALKRVIPAEGLPVRLGRFLHKGYKVWEWRLCKQNQHLLRYVGDKMDVYTAMSTTRRRWKREETGFDAEWLDELCTIRDGTQGTVAITSVAAPPDLEDLPESFLDILQEWGNTWMWDSLRLIGDDNWLLEAIRDGKCIAVTDESYTRELYPDMCSCAFVLECMQGRGRVFGSFLEQTKRACAYRGELLGLMAIHLILLAVNKLDKRVPGLVKIYSDCLGALGRVTSLPANRLLSGCKHSDILKNIMVATAATYPSAASICMYQHIKTIR
jgi:hypothetical protein